MEKFKTHLHTHSDNSTMDGAGKVKKLVSAAKKMGYKSIALTDHGTITGWPYFAMACNDNNIKPIFGVEAYEKRESEILKTTNPMGIRYYHSLFLAKNKKGVQFLRKLVTFSNKKENFYYKPRYTVDFLMEHKDEIKGNIVWSSACMGGRLPKVLAKNNEEEALKYIETMIDIFGEENVFVEVQRHNEPQETIVMNKVIEFAKKYNFNLLATNDIHYINKEDYIAREILNARAKGETLRERQEKGKIYPPELYLKTKEQMDELFLDIPESLTNTGVVEEMVEWVDISEKYWHYPNVDIPEGYTADTYLKEITFEMMKEKYPINTFSSDARTSLEDRLSMELDVMAMMNASAYMLIDIDFINYAKNNGIRVGKGRGSAAGSAVCYCTGITDVEPIQYSLFFERQV